MNRNSERFLDIYGERWYLRDFDFFPEMISDRIEREGDITENFIHLCEEFESNFKWYKTKKEALFDCMRIRKMLNMHIPNTIKDMYIEECLKEVAK